MVEDFKENYLTGWIKLFRSTLNHWLWPKGKPFTYIEAWLYILLTVNHNDDKCLIGKELIECKRGQKLYSLQTWAKEFNWSIQNVRTFFALLEKDNMIICEGLQKTTRLTVCNYETYQNNQQTTNKLLTNNQQTTNNNIRNKELKNKSYIDRIYFESNKEIDSAFKDYLKLRIKHKYTMTDRAIEALVKKLRQHSGNDTKKALTIIENAILGKWQSFYPEKE